ncbi:MAG: hypothetical protein DRJ66_07110 [Thermoprotei archaeon]|nr:MAG: hypothetical protein DRJ66_07110 [Thermoprotei archaeon]RLF20189.1 MAG: hypothetical protein DRZ82_03070 [Thermoprotei archaeon]
MPKKCDPRCPYFRCLKKSLKFVTKDGRILPPRAIANINPTTVEPWCMWANDVCSGYRCKYVNCIKHALLPDGTCALSVRTRTTGRSIEEEAKAFDKEYLSLKDKLKHLRIRELDIDLI